MRNLLLIVWLTLPVGAVAYHYGPGQDRLRDDRAGDAIEEALAAAKSAREIAARDGEKAAKSAWVAAEAALDAALGRIDPDRVEAVRELRLERAKAQMFVSKLPEARADLERLVDELQADPAAPGELVTDARDALANAQYYRTWLMRLEGAPREEWEPEIEASRQNYKLLAEDAERSGDGAAAERAKENLESSIRLARMDLSELQGLPLPSQ